MARDRIVDVYVPIDTAPVDPATGDGGVGVAGPIAAAFGGVVGFAALLCVAVSCTDFGESEIPAGPGCAPFCPTSTTAPLPGAGVTR